MERKGAAGQRDRLLGVGGRDRLHQFAEEELFGLGLVGRVEKGAQAVVFDRVACAAEGFSLLRPRLPGSGVGFAASRITNPFGLGFGVGSGSGLGHTS